MTRLRLPVAKAIADNSWNHLARVMMLEGRWYQLTVVTPNRPKSPHFSRDASLAGNELSARNSGLM